MNKAQTQHSTLSTQSSALSPQYSTLWLMTFLLLLAAALRLIGINNVSPPGLEHDEVAHWLINEQILAGNHAVYFTDAYGHEAGYHYFQTLFQILLGDNAFALRLPSVVLGLLGIAVSFALVRRLFGRNVALVAAAYLSILFFPIFYSRLALRAIALPVVSGLSAYFWWQGWQLAAGRWSLAVGKKPAASRQPLATNLSVSQSPLHNSPFTVHHSQFSFALAGLCTGLSLYTYLAARAVPIFYALFIGYLALFHWREFRQRWQGVVLFGMVAVVAAAPLLFYLLNNPGAEVRVGEVDAPLRALLAGDVRPVLNNGWAILRMFIGPGDPLWRQNVAFRAVFEPVSALLFYVGVGLSLWRWRDSRYAFLLLWAGTATIPSLVTVDAPSYIRIINILPILGVFPALVMHSLIKLSTEKAELSTVRANIGYKTVLALLLLINITWTVRDTFITWPENEGEVWFVWQKALTDAAQFLDNNPIIAHATIAGWTPESMDAPTMELTLQREDLTLRYLNPTRTLVVPSGMPAAIVRPNILPLAPELEAQLLDWGIEPVAAATFTHYPLTQLPNPTPAIPDDTIFGGEFRFLGLSSQPSGLITYWQLISTPTSSRRVFVHVLDEGGEIVVQNDGLDAAAVSLQPDDLILLVHPLTLPELYRLRLGIYDPTTGQRLLTPQGADALLCTPEC